MKINLRRAERHDCSRLLELVQELATYERAPEEVTVTLEEFEQAGFSERPVWWAFVIEEDEKIVGFALYYIRYSTWKGNRMYLEDILVTESCRGKGYGAMLFERLLQEVNDRNLGGVVWQVLDWNQPAINFYNKYQASYDAEWLNGSLSRSQVDQILEKKR